MLDGQKQAVAFAAEVEVGVAPGPEVTTSAKRLAGEFCGALAGVVHEGHRGFEGARQLTKGREDGRYLAGVVFVLCDPARYVTWEASTIRKLCRDQDLTHTTLGLEVT